MEKGMDTDEALNDLIMEISLAAALPMVRMSIYFIHFVHFTS